MTHKTNQSGRNYKDFMIQKNGRERSRKEKKKGHVCPEDGQQR